MEEMKYIYGPVPSRRLGLSLGVSPIPQKTCNYSCIYCQLGRTNPLTNTRKMFYPVSEIMREFNETLQKNIAFDVVTIVGEGEPTLYSGLGELIAEIKKKTEKPVAVITNGALLYDKTVREELFPADIVLPTVDAYDEASFKKINRPHGTIGFEQVKEGLRVFSEEYKGQLWIEIMLMDKINDDQKSLEEYAKELKKLKYERLYINTPIRPPAESEIKAIDHEKMERAVDFLGGISIDLLESEGFHSEIVDDLEAIISIIKRHPMNQFEIEGFLASRACGNIPEIMDNLKQSNKVKVLNYKGFETYRLK
ncbi:MAG: radical SAM protein [Eubacteriales bacterium]|nr:radical SAM protein [Eubacteriales bacterium]